MDYEILQEIQIYKARQKGDAIIIELTKDTYLIHVSNSTLIFAQLPFNFVSIESNIK